MIKTQTLQLITYGCGDKFYINLFENVRNRCHVKPLGGLWASPVRCAYGWESWCLEQEFNLDGLVESFQTVYTGRTLIVNCVEDLNDLIWQRHDFNTNFRDCYWFNWPDYEAMARHGIDAIYLTEEGEFVTRHTKPGLYGYDCECVFVMNPYCVKNTVEKELI